MEYNLIIPDSVEKQIDDIFDYIYSQSLSIKTATKVYEKIYSTIYGLDFLPYIYQIYYKDYRSKNVLNYKIFYKINEEKKEVYIYEILNSSQDFSKIL